MEECGPEEFAQLQYNNVKLQDELDELKKHALFIEENYNSLLSTSSQKEDYIKRSVVFYKNTCTIFILQLIC